MMRKAMLATALCAVSVVGMGSAAF
ncbi:MAG: hypothetical protein QOI08_215, partial [Actinomycetota bacterium]|nr:hypothetical protein [Actinomycetota bacterium]